MKRALLAVLALGALLLTGCTSEPTTPPTAQQVQDDIRSSVTSTCDEIGNRVYLWRGYKSGGIFVVPADPSCAR